MRIKVYGGLIVASSRWPFEFDTHHRQARVIVAARSKTAAKDALEASGVWMSVGEFNRMMSETGNQVEIEVAMSEPGSVFAAKDGPVSRRECKRVWEGDPQ